MVSRSSLRTLCVALLAAALVGCESATDVVAPLEQPSEALSPQELGPDVPDFKRVFVGPSGVPVVLGEAVDEGEVSDWVDPRGAFLFLPAKSGASCTGQDARDFFNGEFGGCHVLWIPHGSLSQPAYVTMRRVSGNHVRVDLTATSKRGLKTGDSNDIGREGFRRPVYLMLNYGAVGVEVDEDDILGIASIEDGGLKGVRTFVDEENGAAYAQLRHFSGYILVRL